MKFLYSTLLLLIPFSLQAQGLLESMQADIAASKQKVDSLSAELLAQKAKVATLETDMAGQKVITSSLISELNKEKIKVATLEASVAINRTSITSLEVSLTALTARVAALEGTQPPPPAPTELNLELKGGWRLKGEYARGQLAIDYATMRAFVVGHEQRNEVYEYQLPAMGTGSDYSQWPAVTRTQTIAGWWTGGYGSGIIFKDGQLRVCPKKFYDTTPPTVTEIFAQDGTLQTVSVPRQRFGGFVKGVGSLELGGGGYESGQGWARGPTLAKLDGTKLIDFPQTSVPVNCCPREPNYWPADPSQSAWVCMGPVDGKGYWSCDRVPGGGLRFSHGVYYWATMGIGDLNYSRQNETFAAENKVYLYHFDPATYQLKGWKEWHVNPALRVRGQEISPDGKYVYLTRTNAWKSGIYVVDPILEVYEVK